MTNRNRPQPVDTVVDAVAVYRLTRLLQRDSVPPMPAIRQAVLDRIATTPYGQLVDCPWCLSVWIGLLVAIARRVSPRLWAVAAFVLASSAVAGVITEWVDTLEPEERIELAPPTWSGPERNEL